MLHLSRNNFHQFSTGGWKLLLIDLGVPHAYMIIIYYIIKGVLKEAITFAERV